MKKICILLLTLTLCLAMTGCCLRHDWQEATCTVPRTCRNCGETEGEVIGHYLQGGSCTELPVCLVCGESAGELLPHQWQAVSCAAPRTCLDCGEAEGQALPHTWLEATQYDPQTCSVCGATEGTADNFLSQNGLVVGNINTGLTEVATSGVMLVGNDRTVQEPAPMTFEAPVWTKLESKQEGYNVYEVTVSGTLNLINNAEKPYDSIVDFFYLFDLHTGKFIPFTYNGVGRGETVEFDGQKYRLTVAATDAWKSGNPAPSADNDLLVPMTHTVRFTLTLPEGYEGLTLVIPSTVSYDTGSKFFSTLAREFTPLTFASYPELFSHIVCLRMAPPEGLE